MNKEKLRRYKCIKDNKENNPIFELLTCYEQAQYQVLNEIVNDDIKKALIFCNDINPIYVMDEKKNYHDVYASDYEKKDNIFKEEKIFVKNNDYFSIIKEEIDKGNIITFQTMFDMVYPYCWYEENAEGNHKEHFATILDYDEKYYYFVDSPYVLEKKRNILYEENNSINLIEKQNLHKAFERLCNLSIIKINKNKLCKIEPIINIIENSVDIYFKGGTKVIDTTIAYLGKEAYEILNNSMKSDNYFCLFQTVFASHWQFHVILSRHKLLQICLAEDINLKKERIYPIVMQELKETILLWDKLKLKVLLNSNSPMINYREKLMDNIILLYQQEDILMNSLLELCDKGERYY